MSAKMKYVLLLLTMKLVKAKIELYVMEPTPLVQIGSRFYQKELLTDEFDGPKELAYDVITKNLYFMYMDDKIQNSGRALINVVTKESLKIKGIEQNKATAVNVETGEVYFGSVNGLYKYDPYTNKANNIGLYNSNIHKLVIRNNTMYLLDANNHMIYRVIGEGYTTRKVGNWPTVMEFNVDNDNNIYFVNMCGVFCAVNETFYVKNKDLSVVYHFIVDEDKVFGVTYDGIYELSCEEGTAQKMAHIDFFPKSIIFGEYGHIFYSIDNSIFRLRPVNSYLVYNVYKRQT